MSNCELCGKEDILVYAKVEGTEMNVCKTCGSFGTILKKPVATGFHRAVERRSRREKELPAEEVLVAEFADRLRRARKKVNMTQKEFASKLNEKESIIHKVESSSFHPPIDLAKKWARILHITLVELEKPTETVISTSKDSGPMTIGDMLKRKK